MPQRRLKLWATLKEMLAFISAGSAADRMDEKQEWLRRALANAKAAKVLVAQQDPELLVEAVTQVQQACEKATKAVLLAHGKSYSELTSMGHNTIGAFIVLVADMMQGIPFAAEFSQVVLRKESGDAAFSLAKMVLRGHRNKRRKNDVIYAFKQVLPPASDNLGNKALDTSQWERLTRAFPPHVVDVLIRLHNEHRETWYQYIDQVPTELVDPRPLIAEEVDAETWVFEHAGFPRRFPGRESSVPTNPDLSQLVQRILEDYIIQGFRQGGRRSWPRRVNARKITVHISDWIMSLLWLFFCAIVTTPHAVSSRYPANESQSEMGSQHYSNRLGVVARIGPLADNTEEVIQTLMTYYKDIEDGYSRMLR